VFGTQNFITCIGEQLAARGFGQKRQQEIIDRFIGLRDGYHAAGNVADADTMAMARVFSELAFETKEKARLAASNLAKVADAKDRFDNYFRNTKVFRKGTNEKVAPGRIAMSFIEHDPRSGGLSYASEKEAARGRLYAAFGDALEIVGKGAFGRQRGKAHLTNIVRETFGQSTGDGAATEVARAWRRTHELSVDMLNAAGGAIRKLKDWHLPQRQSAAAVAKDKQGWLDFHRDSLDWDKMRWPDGSRIKPEQREDVLLNVYRTLSSGGANKIDPGAFNGRGSAVGNQLDNHRFLVYRDADAWLQMHERYGDGSVFDVMVSHVENMAHNIALVQMFGSNPSHMKDTIKAMALKRAEALDAARTKPLGKNERAWVSQTEAQLKNTFEPGFELITRTNPMDPDSVLGNLVTGASNLITSAVLGSASFLAIPGDFVTQAAVKFFNNQSISGGVDFYMKSLLTDRKLAEKIAVQTGFVHDEVVTAVYAAERFTGLGTLGPAWTKRFADITLRLSALTPHTRAARFSVQAEWMGMMAREAGKSFDDLPFKDVMRRYGITPAMWDKMRTYAPYEPKPGVQLLRPLDAADADEEVYRRFHGMIMEESRRMIPEATVEGQLMLKSTERPDTLPGALLYSFAMFKNFPVSMMMIYGRLAMSSPDVRGRLSYLAALGAGLTMVGALGTQMREVSKGRDPLPMDTPTFWGKAVLSGGALSIWGDFLFQGVNSFGSGPQDVAAGPVVGMLGDTTNLLFGGTFKWAESVGSLTPEKAQSSFAAKGVEYARRYAPGASIWWARKPLEAAFFDRLEDMADPQAYRKRQLKVKRRRANFGNDYFWQPGDVLPSRLPEYRSAR
jgi:hypothetical protein